MFDGHVKAMGEDAKRQQKKYKSVIENEAKKQKERDRIAGRMAQAPIKVIKLMELYLTSKEIQEKRRKIIEGLPEILHETNKTYLSPIFIRNFLIMDLLVSTHGHQTDTFCNMLLEEWASRDIDEDGTVTVIVLEHKTGKLRVFTLPFVVKT